ncbi:39345_t:CDS:1, partial [Gigaspora margarita]
GRNRGGKKQGRQTKKKGKLDFEKLTFETYQALKNSGEAIEDSLDLENLVRRF